MTRSESGRVMIAVPTKLLGAALVALICVANVAAGEREDVQAAASTARVTSPDLFQLGDGADPGVPGLAGIVGIVGRGPDWSDLFNADGSLRDDYDADGVLVPGGNGIPDAIDRFGGRAAYFIADDVSAGARVDRTVLDGAEDRWTSGSVSAMHDLGNSYVFVTKDPAGNTVLYLGLERLTNRGPSRITAEFNQVAPTLDEHGAIVRERTGGDLSIRIAYDDDGLLAGVDVLTWTAVAKGSFDYRQAGALEGEGCNPAQTLCAYSNADVIGGGAWASYDRSGNPDRTLAPNTFTELGVNVGALAGVDLPPHAIFSSPADLAAGREAPGRSRPETWDKSCEYCDDGLGCCGGDQERACNTVITGNDVCNAACDVGEGACWLGCGTAKAACYTDCALSCAFESSACDDACNAQCDANYNSCGSSCQLECSDCLDDYTCDSACAPDNVFSDALVCATPRQPGDSCGPAAPCQDGAYCWPLDLTCYPDARENEGVIATSDCLALYNQDFHENVVIGSDTTLTYGIGGALSAGVSGSFEGGVVYGDDGRFGCYATLCAGVTTDAEVSVYASQGQYVSYNSVSGLSSVYTAEAGEGVVFQVSYIFLPGSICAPDFSEGLIGTTQALSLEVSLSPFAVGCYECTTFVTTVIGNDPPTADSKSVATNEDTALAIGLTGGDTNDPSIAFSIVSGPSHGSLGMVSSTGNYAASVTYTPSPNYFGADSFTFKTNDGTDDSGNATVSITVRPVNDPPTANSGTAATDEDNAVVIALTGGDIDSADSSVSFSVISGPSHGSLGALSDNGAYSVKVTYTPSQDYFGTDSFTFRTNDGMASSGTATMSITVRPVNDAPTANNASATTDEDNAVVVVLTGGDVDNADASVGFSVIGGPSHGSLGALSDNGAYSVKVTYTPNQDYFGTDSFTFRTNDGSLNSPLATATITVKSVNDAPVITWVNPASQALQYSDAISPVTVTARDVDSSSLSLSGPGLASLSASGGCVQTQFGDSSSPGSSCSWTISGQMLEPAGSYLASLTVSDGSLAATGSVNFAVATEDAVVTIDPDNVVAEQVAVDGGNSGAFTLAFTVREVDAPDDVPGDSNLAGDITKGEPTMALVPVGPGGPVAGVCREVGTTLLKADPDSPYDYEELRVECDFVDVPVNTYAVEIALVSFAPLDKSAVSAESVVVDQVIYYSAINADTETDVLTIFDPSLGFTTGGGWFYWPGTEDEAAGYAGDKTNFGYTMKYNNKRTKVQGSLLAIRHLADGTVARVKSNALEGLSLSPNDGSFGWAAFSGKATYQAIGWPEPLGNYRFTVYVEDHGTPGVGRDRAWIQVTDSAAVVQPDLSLPAPAPVNAELLKGGNIQVP